MKNLKQIGILFMASLLFLGSLGFNVFAHICHKDGLSISYVVPKEHGCEKKVEIASCCHESKTSQELKACDLSPSIDEDCCSEEVWSYKIPSDFEDYSQAQITFVPLASIVTSDQGQCLLFGAKETISLYPNPPPQILSGKEIIIRHQVFRI